MANVVIVGGGITGLYSALLLNSRGNEVTVVERSDKPGGLLRSIRDEDGLCFDYGCHFIKESGVPGVDEVAYDLNPSEWHVLDHNLNAGNYFSGTLNTKSLFIQSKLLRDEIYNRGIVDFMALDPRVNDVTPKTLEDYYLNKFGKTFTDHIFEPVSLKIYGRDLDQLTPKAHVFLSLVRFLAFSPDTTVELKRSPFYDARLAFHDASKDGYGGLKSYYPREGGIESWVDHFLGKVASTNIELVTSDEVEVINITKERVVSVELASGRVLPCDQMVWSVPLIGFLRASRTEFAGRPPSMIHVALFNYVFDRSFESDLYYVTNYDAEFSMFRVTMYPNFSDTERLRKDHHHCTVEVFSPNPVDTAAAIEILPDELLAMGLLSEEANVVSKSVVDLGGVMPSPTLEYEGDFDRLRRLATSRADNVMFLGLANGHFLQNDAPVQASREIRSGWC